MRENSAMELRIGSQDLAAIVELAERAHPLECCGLLVGRAEKNWVSIAEIHPTANAWEGEAARDFEATFAGRDPDFGIGRSDMQPEVPTAERRYTIDPRIMLAVQKSARDRGLAIVGVYHSHPEHPAIPSEYDREFAWSGYVYPIVSVQHGQPSTVRAWAIGDDRQFRELTIAAKRHKEI
ncbi:MAG: Mov34/MPN/PAD-1 family protein [Geitlerinemataceae cyanobacterium]